MIKQIVTVFLLPLAILHTTCNRHPLGTNNSKKSICLTISTTEHVSPIAPYGGLAAHYDCIPRRLFSIDNNTVMFSGGLQEDVVDSIYMVVILTIKMEGIHSGECSGDRYIIEFPYVYNYASEFWKSKSKPYQLIFDSINGNGEIYYKYQENNYMLKPGNPLILRDTACDTITNPVAGKNDILYAHRYIKTDSIFNYGYLPFEKKP